MIAFLLHFFYFVCSLICACILSNGVTFQYFLTFHSLMLLASALTSAKLAIYDLVTDICLSSVFSLTESQIFSVSFLQFLSRFLEWKKSQVLSIYLGFSWQSAYLLLICVVVALACGWLTYIMHYLSMYLMCPFC